MDMFILNGTFLFTFFSFILFMLLMKNLFFDPIRRIKAERAQKIETDEQTARTLVKEFEVLNQDYEQELKVARQNAQKLILESREAAKKQASSQIAQVRQDTAAQLEQQMNDLAQWREETYQQLAPERTLLANGIIEKLGVGGGSLKASATSSVN